MMKMVKIYIYIYNKMVRILPVDGALADSVMVIGC
jgi:hypothetical protein